jgi:ribonuclease D
MIWIDRQPAFDSALERLRKQNRLAIDTEADSLHSYYDKVCLIQVSVPDEDLIIDPLTKMNLDDLGAILGDPAVNKVLHGADYDLRIMNRDFGWTVRNLIDTSICAQLLGYEAIGLAALLDRHFGVKLNKVHQRADWSVRPLPQPMLEYAVKDTHHLIELADRLRAELEAAGRWEWALEEFGRLESIRFRESEDDVESWRKLKNLGNLDRRGLAIVREIHTWRENLAKKGDRPPFKVLGNDAIVELAKARPASRSELGGVKVLSRHHADRYGSELLRLIRAANAIEESELPEPNEKKPWLRDKALEKRVEKLKKIRDRIAAEHKVDPAVLSPRHALTAVAMSGTLDVPAMREWQKRLLGREFLDALSEYNPATWNATTNTR